MISATMEKTRYSIILFYKYISIRNTGSLKNTQRELCEKLGLRGRVIIGKEGINATLEGTHSAVARYRAEVRKDKRFSDIVFKHSIGTGKAFPRLSIKVREEIVTLGVPIKNRRGGKYISSTELRSLFRKKEDITILDVRNKYETQAGHFSGSVNSNISNFRELPKLADNLHAYEEKKIVMVCTGGIRCEIASRFFRQKGYKNVYQLKGGIATYIQKYPGQDFLGSLYVFDNRILMHAEGEKHTIIGTCASCGKASERYTNCAYDPCHIHFICCEMCEKQHSGYCSKLCAKNKTKKLVKLIENR